MVSTTWQSHGNKGDEGSICLSSDFITSKCIAHGGMFYWLPNINYFRQPGFHGLDELVGSVGQNFMLERLMQLNRR